MIIVLTENVVCRSGKCSNFHKMRIKIFLKGSKLSLKIEISMKLQRPLYSIKINKNSKNAHFSYLLLNLAKYVPKGNYNLNYVWHFTAISTNIVQLSESCNTALFSVYEAVKTFTAIGPSRQKLLKEVAVKESK